MPIINSKKELKQREKNDFYPTDERVVHALYSYLKDGFMLELGLSPSYLNVLDAGCGDGIFARIGKQYYPHMIAIGVEYEGDRVILKDSLDCVYRITDYNSLVIPEKANLVIGNPPYKYANSFITNTLDNNLSDDGVCMFLLRTQILESKIRFNIYKQHKPSHIIVLSKRPSFSGDKKTDADSYLFLVFDKKQKEKTETRWMLFDHDILGVYDVI